MPGPSFLSHDVRGGSGNMIARLVRGGTFSELLGVTGVTGTKAPGASTSATTFFQTGSIARYRGDLYAATRVGVVVLNPITGLWVTAFSFPSPAAAGTAMTPSSIVVIDTATGSYLVTAYHTSATGQHVWVRFDGTSWTTTAAGGASTRRTLIPTVHKGLIHAHNGGDNGSFNMMSFNPSTQAAAVSTPVYSLGWNSSGGFFKLDDRLFILVSSRQGLGTGSKAYEFAFGAWTDSGLVLDAISSNGGLPAGITVNNEAFVFAPDFVGGGIKLYKFTVASPGGALAFSAITSPVPPALRAGSTTGTPSWYRFYTFADTCTTPGSVSHYVLFFPDNTDTSLPTLFRWVNDATEMANVASPQITGSSTMAQAEFGGGEYLNGTGTTPAPLVTTSPEGNSKGISGVKISYSSWGDPVKIEHDAAGGTFTAGLTVTQAPSGATGVITHLGPNEVWLKDVTGSWTNGQAFTDTATGSAAQNAAATGGDADKTVEARYFLGAGQTGLGAPVTGICTLVPGSATGGGAVVGNQVQGVTADGRLLSFEWDFLSDGIPEALTDHVQLFITRP